MDSDKSFVVLDRPAVPQEAASGTGWGAALGTGWGAAPGTGWDTWARHGEANLEDSRPMQDRPRAAGVDSSNRHYGNNWEAGQGWGDLPRQTQSAQVPPVAGGYPLPQPQYRSVPAPYQQHLNQQLEPLFVAVNPFQARGWRRPARTAQPEPGGSTGHLVWSVPPPQSIQPFVPAGDATNRPVWTAPPDQFIPPVIPAGDATSRPGWNILPHDFIPPVMPPWADDQAGHAPGAPPAPGPFWRTVPPMPVSSPPIVPDPTNQDSVEDPRPRLYVRLIPTVNKSDETHRQTPGLCAV
ncbi:hypothetical protein DFH08DRAFT_826092 [Mycena albidolilacea]|uniref:Uncharacterized protein n=1 Tax=Mycena albidolilacea TaxID=1033008 RepID=A0AAD6Z116_9AGAR|nr:hypothetical protein DFH08DRAFT_826092 [Mycena albidolilacea]